MIFQKSILVSAVSSLFLSAETFAVNALDLAIVNGQAPSICTKIVEFSACTTEAATNQANCNNLVTDVPGFDYWECVCAAQRETLTCYALCPDDAQMQLQYRANEASAINTCEYVDKAKAAGLDEIEIEETEEIDVGGNKITVPKPKEKELPPLPTSNTTDDSVPISISFDSSAGSVAASIVTLPLALLAAALF